MSTRRPIGLFISIGLLTGAGIGAFLFRHDLSSWFTSRNGPTTATQKEPVPLTEAKVLKLSPQARKNLGLVAKAASVQTYWKTIQVPGVIVDRPGVSDRGITAPAVGVVTQIHAFPGDTVKPGDKLFSLRVFSEYLQTSQTELYKASREAEMIQEHLVRLEELAKKGAIAENKLIEEKHDLRRQQVAIAAHRQDLLTRGLSPSQIDAVADGRFVSTIEVTAPAPLPNTRVPGNTPAPDLTPVTIPIEREGPSQTSGNPAYEVQELKAELGQQVQAGQLLCLLSNHQSLYIEGHAFKQEATFLEQAAQNRWPVQVEFAEDDSQHWPSIGQTFHIRYLANTIDPTSRTFDFYLPLTNQSRGYEQNGRTFVVWRFRPGQRVRLHVPVEQMQDVIVLPSSAIAREGGEAYVFRQNGDLFDRRPVHVLHEDRLNVVLANDGSIKPGLYLAQNAAASLNRVLKAQAASGVRADVHVHADGTVHAAH